MNILFSFSLLMVMLAGACFAVLGLAYKMSGVYRCRSTAFSSVFLFIAAVLAGGLACSEPVRWSDWRLWSLGVVMGFTLYAAITLVVRVNRLGSASISWLLINLSFLIPVLLSALFLNESFRRIDILVLVLFVLMLMALRNGLVLEQTSATGKNSLKTFGVLLTLAFLLNGLFQFGTKLKDTFFQDSNAAGLAVILYGTGTVLAIITHTVSSGSLRISKHECTVGTLAGIASGSGNLLFLNGMSLPATVSFPVSLSISLIGGIALTTLFYKEPVNKGKVLGWALGIALLLLAVFRDSIG
jgi:drug/metabolite transporter (DMT)-like permease